MSQDELLGAVEDLTSGLLDDMGLEIIDVEWQGEPGGAILRFFLDRQGGVDLETCGKASEVIGHALDRSGLLGDRYRLEVSSPGFERPLKRPRHFQQFIGSKVLVRTLEPVEGRRNFTGMLESADEMGIRVVVDGDQFGLAYEEIRKANLVYEFERPEKPGHPGVKSGATSGPASKRTHKKRRSK